MSSRLVGHVLEYYPKDCSLGEFVLALTIADEAAHSGDNVRAAPSEMARLSRQSEKNVRRLLKKMESGGWLQCTVRSAVGGRGITTRYQINPEWVQHPCMNKQGQNLDTMSMFPAPKPGHHVQVSDPAPFSLKALPPLPPKIEPSSPSGSAVPSATAAGVEEDQRLARWMFKLILELNPKHREPNWKRWCRDIRVMTGKGHTHHDVAALFKWANGDRVPHPGGDFCWATNILSPAKLWAQWDVLTIKRAADPASQATPTVDPLCSVCHARPWTLMQGKAGERTCGQCYDQALPHRHKRVAA